MARPPSKRGDSSPPLSPEAQALFAARVKELQPLRREWTQRRQGQYAHLVPEWEIHDLGHDLVAETALKFDPRVGCKLTTYYCFLFDRRIVGLLEAHGHRKCPECQGRGAILDDYCHACDAGWVHKSAISGQDLCHLPDLLDSTESHVDPSAPFAIDEEWLSERSMTFIAILVLIKKQLPEDKQIILWADIMGRDLSQRDLNRLEQLKGAPMTKEAVRKARHDGNMKVEKIIEQVRRSFGAEGHPDVSPQWFGNKTEAAPADPDNADPST